MGIDPIRAGIEGVDMRNRFYHAIGVGVSPTAAAEVVVGSLTITENEVVEKGIWLSGWVAITIGTSGASLRLRIRQTNVSGLVVADSGALTGGVAAGNLLAQDVDGVDVAPVMPGQVYALTAQVGSGAATSAISAFCLKAAVV